MEFLRIGICIPKVIFGFAKLDPFGTAFWFDFLRLSPPQTPPQARQNVRHSRHLWGVSPPSPLGLAAVEPPQRCVEQDSGYISRRRDIYTRIPSKQPEGWSLRFALWTQYKQEMVGADRDAHPLRDLT